MAADFIPIDRTDSTAVFSNKLVALAPELRRVIDKLEEIQQMGYRMFVADPADFTMFESLFGIPTGQGQTVFNRVNGALLAIKGEAQNANAIELINTIG
jgi:hypothetical protein